MHILFFLILFFNLHNLNATQVADLDVDRRLFMPRTLALSGSMTSRINLNESIYFNPASSAHSRCFAVDGGVSWNKLPALDGRADTYFVNAIDTDSDLFGGGIGYAKRSFTSGGSEWELKGIINKLAFKNRLAIGIGVSYLSTTHLAEKNNNFNTDFGLLFLLAKKSLLGFTAYNLLGDKHNINNRSLAFGFRHTMWDFFSVDIDFEHRLKRKIMVSGALELLYNNGIMLTLSGKRNEYLKNSYWGMGLGYVGPKISIIYGTMNAITAPFSFAHSASIRIFF